MRARTAPRTGLAVIAAAVLLAACAAPPRADTTPPAQDLPAGSAGVAAVPATWWTSFGDARIDALVAEALQNNRDVARAVARIDQSRAALRLASADRLPSINAGASAARQRVSENGAVPLNGASPIGNDYRVAINVAYEVDLWSRLGRTRDAAREELLASTYARDTLRNALAAQVVQAYVSLQALDAQYTLFDSAVQAQRESLKLQRLRFDAGDIAELDIRQLEAELIANDAQLPKLARARGEAERALSLVLGRTPRAVVESGVAREASPTTLPPNVALPEGLPSDLLQRRPDVQAAEARLRAAGARVDAARAAYFPSISLTAALGQESTQLSKLTDGPSLIWSVLASLTQPIWNGGRIDAQNELARARQREAEIDYRDTVAVAFKEARDAIGGRSETEQSLRNAIERERALSRAAQLTALRFNGGESSRLDLIEAERAALAAQSQAADARRALAAAQADLFRVLGGGWQVPDEASAKAARTEGQTPLKQ
ncbi:efflux transporter outer membrane subunit [Piscinibacter sp. XHJ-5]|uniref:efflux transporter outer membrane subunit n=1 Tax=Piscinibacter sp. XHJ-5 TaxID=3037797 RepID=UPI00245312C1|nr:efflux transporter outer membrane subunit [Piscinibacter sp. XHJ-5]